MAYDKTAAQKRCTVDEALLAATGIRAWECNEIMGDTATPV